MILLDTDIIIDYLRGNPEALRFVDELTEAPATSVIVVAGLYAGVRDGSERDKLEALLAGTRLFPLTIAGSVEGGLYRRQFGKSHGVGLDDCLIAATAQLEGAKLVTLNRKHYPMLSDVLVPYLKS